MEEQQEGSDFHYFSADKMKVLAIIKKTSVTSENIVKNL